LPPVAQDRLLDDITALSPAGTRLATEQVYDGARNDVGAYLDHRGWQSVMTVPQR